MLVFTENDYLNFNADLGGVGQNLPPIAEKAFLHSHLFRFVSLRLNWFNLRLLMGINDIVGIAGLPPPDQNGLELIKHRPGLELLKRNLIAVGDDNVKHGLQLLNTLSEQHGFKVLMAIWPAFDGDNILDYETLEVSKAVLLPETQPLHVERLAAAYGIMSFRLSPFFQEDAKRARQQGKAKGLSLQEYYTCDGMHPLDAGNRVAATALQQIILSHPSFWGPENHPVLK